MGGGSRRTFISCSYRCPICMILAELYYFSRDQHQHMQLPNVRPHQLARKGIARVSWFLVLCTRLPYGNCCVLLVGWKAVLHSISDTCLLPDFEGYYAPCSIIYLKKLKFATGYLLNLLGVWLEFELWLSYVAQMHNSVHICIVLLNFPSISLCCFGIIHVYIFRPAAFYVSYSGTCVLRSEFKGYL